MKEHRPVAGGAGQTICSCGDIVPTKEFALHAADLVRLLDEYEKARQWDSKVGEADNSGNVAGDELAAALRTVLRGHGQA